MPLLSEPSLCSEAAILLTYISHASTHGPPLGSMSVSIYDTAWVSMVSKVRDGTRYWLFSQSFELILDSQCQHGGWQQYASDVDGILNTMADMLALSWHRKEPSIEGCPDLPNDLDLRISNAKVWLEMKLNSWNVEVCDHVGFELLVPSLLALLDQEGIDFEFPGLQTLHLLKLRKLSKFDPAMIYDGHPTTLIHSLEAFMGVIDYDRVGQQSSGGSMMASPSSTAAYLIYKSSWDEAAETYLHAVLNQGQGYGLGGFPSAFPTSIFEISWVLSTLLEAGLSPNSSGHYVTSLADFLQEALKNNGGTLGFSPGLLADADDTSKSLTTLSLLGRAVDPCGMIAKFESD